MAEHYSFFDPIETTPGVYDREYNAQEFTDYFGALITTGVMKGAFNMLEVTANGSNMVTSINTGIAFVEAKRYFNDAPLPFTHDTETIGLSRIDRIVVRMDRNVNARYVRAFIKKGTASTNPAPPALTQNNTVYEISLAQIRVTGGQTFIASNAVTDERGTDVICPWAGSNILPSFDDNALATHINNDERHIKPVEWITATLVNGWQQIQVVPLKFSKDGYGKVHISGWISRDTVGTVTLITTLPIGYRPSTLQETGFITDTEGNTYLLEVGGDGSVYTRTAPRVAYINFIFPTR